MKKITIGRNNACDIVIPDTTDLVSRKQAVITYSFFGKMVLYDTSNNGTYVNGQKMKEGEGVRVTRKDKVNFARIADLNWDDVKDPYYKTKMYSYIAGVVLVIIALLLVYLLSRPSKEDAANPAKVEISHERGETFTTVEPQIEQEPQSPKNTKKHKKRRNNKKEESEKPTEVLNKEVDNHSPIVY